MQRILCIWLPEWPIQRLVVANREREAARRTPATQPIVLHARDARRGQLVVACCSRSQKLGVRAGMPLAEVSALQKNLQLQSEHVARANAFTLEEHEPELDNESLSDLAVWCEQFSPIVGLENCDREANSGSQASPTSLLLDVTGLASIFGSEERLLELVEAAFEGRGYQVRVGFGNTVGAAWAVAHYGDDVNCKQHWQADVNVDADFAEDTTVDVLAPLPVQALRLSSATVDVLLQLGVETVGQLLELPRAGLATRLGDALIERIDQALGAKPEVIVAHRAAPEFDAKFEIEHPTTRRNVIERVLQQLSAEVCQLLEKSDHAAVQVEAELRAQKVTRKLFVSLFQPTSNARHIEELLLLQLDALQMQQRIKHIRLAAVTTVRIAGQQHVLWDEVGHGFARRDSELAQLVDRLSSRLGKESVFGVQAQAGALPEKAYRQKSLTETVKSKRGNRQTSLRRQNTAATLRAPHRPLWLQEPPLPVQLPMRGRPRLRRNHQPPASFQFQDEIYEVAYHWGPERIETGWWAGKSVRRDYYRVETTIGCRFWLFRQLDDGAWYLHGCFE